MILSFLGYYHRLVINLSSPSKVKSLKSEFQVLLSYISLSNNCPIEITFKLSMILSIKQYIGCFVNNLCLYSIGKSSKSEFWGNFPYFMFSNDHSIKIILHCLYFLFYYYLCLEIQFNQYKLLLFLWFIILQLLLFVVLVIIFALFIFDLFVLIDHISIHWSWNMANFFFMDWNKNMIYAVQEMYILHFKQGRQMLIDFHLIPQFLGVYMGHV